MMVIRLVPKLLKSIQAARVRKPKLLQKVSPCYPRKKQLKHIQTDVSAVEICER
jgi:hypothetical protein